MKKMRDYFHSKQLILLIYVISDCQLTWSLPDHSYVQRVQQDCSLHRLLPLYHSYHPAVKGQYLMILNFFCDGCIRQICRKDDDNGNKGYHKKFVSTFFCVGDVLHYIVLCDAREPLDCQATNSVLLSTIMALFDTNRSTQKKKNKGKYDGVIGNLFG